jgi:hypothetical protein
LTGVFKEKGHSSSTDSRSAEFMMSLLLMTASLPFCFTAILISANLDPLWFIIPESKIVFINGLVFLFRYIVSLLILYSCWVNIALLYLAMIINVSTITDISKCLKMLLDSLLLSHSQLEIKGKIKLVLLEKKVLSFQRQSRLITEMANRTYYFFLPSAVLLGESILVITSYATIRMRPYIPMPFYLSIPLLFVCSVIFVIVNFPKASDVYDSSVGFLNSIRFVLGKRSKYMRKVWIAEKPLCIRLGPLFFAKRSTKTTFFQSCMDFTVDALLTY